MNLIFLERSLNFGYPLADQASDTRCFFIVEKDLLQVRASVLQHQSTDLSAASSRMAAGCAVWVQPGAQGCGAEQGPCCAPGAVCRGRDSAACQAQHSACPGSCPGRCGETCGGKEPPGRAGAFCCHSCFLGQGDHSYAAPQNVSKDTLYEERQGRDCLLSNLRDGKKTGGRNLKGAVNSRVHLHARKCCEVGEMNIKCYLHVVW